jgi:hypothetical protein
MNKILLDEVDVNKIVNKAIKASQTYRDCSDGSFEASLYYVVCQEMERLRNDSKAPKDK